MKGKNASNTYISETEEFEGDDEISYIDLYADPVDEYDDDDEFDDFEDDAEEEDYRSGSLKEHRHRWDRDRSGYMRKHWKSDSRWDSDSW